MASAPASPGLGLEPMRVVIVGHVDHGKSTLVGRLVNDTGSLPDGKLEAIKAMCERRGMPFEWAFLMDAFQSERDQGITIDTAQIWLHSATRDYVIIDAPGHREFIKNMITGASSAEAALLMIDASHGIQQQSRLHGFLLNLLGIRQVAVVVNKMDLVGYSASHFEEMCANGIHAVMVSNSPVPVKLIQQMQTLFRATHHCGRDRVIQDHHRIVRHTFQQLVKRKDLGPIRIFSGCGFVVNSSYCRLQLIRSDGTFRKCDRKECYPLRNLFPVPKRPILLGERDQFAVCSDSGMSPRIGRQHQCKQTGDLRIFGLQSQRHAR